MKKLDDDIIDEDIFKEDSVDDNGDGVDIPDLPEKLIKIKFLHSNETEFCEYPPEMEINHRDIVVATGKYGKDLAMVLGSSFLRSEKEKIAGIRAVQTVIRIASTADIEKHEHNLEKTHEAMRICREKISNHKLDMKLVSAHYLLEEPKVLFFFTADARVDFRELVKDLVSVFRMRIELRQIGVRDESRVIGGLGVCGRDFCCHGLADKLNPVSIKMAKDQNLSLNSMKISGPCGRLLCCLSYEYDFYQSERKKYPSEGMRVYSGDKYYRVSEINLLTKMIKLEGPEGISLSAPVAQFEYDQKRSGWRFNEV
ncbi:MAG: regulatory iron-sulfur-containing complex subunit RicT [Spirochaetia bacterium]|jgi:cell fate regulator YaaT (PSP1 superfamily)|nr:regulatory iron-sulfur-containing complex subunit RicT [Spirochaetia bacterium]